MELDFVSAPRDLVVISAPSPLLFVNVDDDTEDNLESPGPSKSCVTDPEYLAETVQDTVNESLCSSNDTIEKAKKVKDDVLVPDSENYDDQVEDLEFLMYVYEKHISYEETDDNTDSVEKVEVEDFVGKVEVENFVKDP